MGPKTKSQLSLVTAEAKVPLQQQCLQLSMCLKAHFLKTHPANEKLMPASHCIF